MKQYSLTDHIIFKLEAGLAFMGKNMSKNMAKKNSNPSLAPCPSKLSGRLLRVNHSGEVCAQALYEAQSRVANDPRLVQHLQQAAREEEAHLEWCETRLKELGTKPSLLNPLWAMGSFAIGTAFGLAGDKISLGFLAETEQQVVQHLDKHLKLLPSDDFKSQEILRKMREDELKHASSAIQEGGIPLPSPIRMFMRLTSKIMTTVAKYI